MPRCQRQQRQRGQPRSTPHPCYQSSHVSASATSQPSCRRRRHPRRQKKQLISFLQQPRRRPPPPPHPPPSSQGTPRTRHCVPPPQSQPRHHHRPPPPRSRRRHNDKRPPTTTVPTTCHDLLSKQLLWMLLRSLHLCQRHHCSSVPYDNRRCVTVSLSPHMTKLRCHRCRARRPSSHATRTPPP
jgi:hypothetical protein